MRFSWALAGALLLLGLSGCAALPVPLQPQAQDNSNAAEGAWLVLASADTLQTMHIRQGTSCDHEADPVAAWVYGSERPRPGRVLVTNLALMTVHTMVTSWLDDKVAAGGANVGGWYTFRVAWHVISIAGTGASVVNNRARGCAL